MPVPTKMNLFAISIIFCSISEFNAEGELERSSPSLRETTLLPERKPPEYIQTEKRDTETAKYDYRYSPRIIKCVQIFHTRNASKLMKRIFCQGATKRGKTIFSSLGTDSSITNSTQNYETPNNYEERKNFSAHNKTLNIHSETTRTVNSIKISVRRNSNFKKSETISSDVSIVNANQSTESENSTHIADEENKNANNFTLSYEYDNISQSNSEILRRMSLKLKEKMASSKYPEKNLSSTSHSSLPTTSLELALNNSETSANSSTTETLNVSSEVYTSPDPNSKRKKTVVAAIVTAINGIIGFTGAAVFTCLKYKYLQNEERRPLIN